MIRRFETYAFLAGISDEQRLELAEVLFAAGSYIPEVRQSAIGWNSSTSPAELVWEHAYESPESYRRYMVHPYHADMIDRYVLPDSPERIVEPMTGAGLFGYHVDEPTFLLPPGSGRRVVLLHLPDAAASAVHELAGRAAELAKGVGATCSSMGANTLAVCWFDGETPLPVPPPRWTHVWELGFPDLGALERHLTHGGDRLPGALDAERWTELCYEVTVPG